MRDACRLSNGVLRDLVLGGKNVQWVQSYVMADRFICIYYAENEDVIREHSRCSGFPANRIDLITDVIDPTRGE